MPKGNDDLTEEQIDALADLLIAIKRLWFSPLGSTDETEAAKATIRSANQVRKVME